MNTQFDTELSKEQTERLALLLEECGEVQQVIGKILRHGYYSHSPHDLDETSNKTLLTKEIADLCIAINLITDNEDIYSTQILNFQKRKKEKVNKYLHFNEVK